MDSPVIMYYTITTEDVVKAKMSEVKDYSSISDYMTPVNIALEKAKTVHVAFGQNVKDVDKRFNRFVIDKTVTIDENVYRLDVLQSGAVAYMRDYNKDREKICDLYAYKNGSSFKIDDDISALLFDVPDNFGFFD